MLPELSSSARGSSRSAQAQGVAPPATTDLPKIAREPTGAAMVKSLAGLSSDGDEAHDVAELARLERQVRGQEDRLRRRQDAVRNAERGHNPNPSRSSLQDVNRQCILEREEGFQRALTQEHKRLVDEQQQREAQHDAHKARQAESQRRKERLAADHVARLDLRQQAPLRGDAPTPLPPPCPAPTLEAQLEAERELEKRINDLVNNCLSNRPPDPLRRLSKRRLREPRDAADCGPPSPSRKDLAALSMLSGMLVANQIPVPQGLERLLQAGGVEGSGAPQRYEMSEVLVSLANPEYHPWVSALHLVPKARWPETLSAVLWPRGSGVARAPSYQRGVAGGHNTWPRSVRLNPVVASASSSFLFGREHPGPLSLAHPLGVVLRGRAWRSAAHFVNAMRFSGTSAERDVAEAEDPEAAARVHPRPQRADWGRVREGIMLEAMEAKLAQHRSVASVLCSTAGAKLVCTDSDSYWGVDSGGYGCNKLGHILTALRERLLSAEG